MNGNKRLAVGILAHVDAGKTTLSEGLLYRSGALKKLGRVDHKTAFLDTDALERERGITIFSKQAVLPLETAEITLLDTPGHVDFSTEMERTLPILDYAILVISGSDGVQGHTQTLWDLLARYRVPTFLFVNKMDLAGTDRAALLSELKQRLGEGCVDFGQEGDALWESIALLDEDALAQYLEEGRIGKETIRSLLARRRLFPCYFGSALKLDGVDAFLHGLEEYTQSPAYPTEFGARVYKISRDAQGTRLTHLKITGGSLKVKALLTGWGRESGEGWEEKADQIRIYSGQKYQMVEEAPAGTICAVTGLSETYPGQGLGWEAGGETPLLEPVLTYQVLLPQGVDPYAALLKLRQLEEEEPQLHLVWNEALREIHLQLMGTVQMEVLQRLIGERFGLAVTFGPGNIVYRETIARPVVGVGHFEPLRHYAEVHLLLEPGERGSGLQLSTVCSEDVLDRNWQRLILTHLEEKVHLGVLTGSPITDLSITLIAGRGHEKHTEGGDFRQATYRAVRQGLMRAESVLLEPWYRFRLEVPAESLGRAMADIQRMFGEAEPPETLGETVLLTGVAPVAGMGDYAMEVASYTRGRGKLTCVPAGYRPCHNAQEVIAAVGYDPVRDLENPADSVFCSHGAGVAVKWDEVEDHMHLHPSLPRKEEELPAPPSAVQSAQPTPRMAAATVLELDKELQAIYERTYGPIKRRDILPRGGGSQNPWDRRDSLSGEAEREYLLVDGYNIIFAWEELKQVAQDNLDTARQLLMNLLSNYQGFRQCEVILVFDAYKVPGNPGEVSRFHNIYVVYTKEAETADAYIEKATYEIGRRHKVRVATSDNLEQLIILGHGAVRISADLFRAEVEGVNGQISALLSKTARSSRNLALKDAWEKANQNQE